MPEPKNPIDITLRQRWIDIDTGALANNVKVLKQTLGGPAGPKLMAVVKANAYGHGAAGVAPVLRDAGADAFGVTTLDEALELVNAGIDSRNTPILVFSPLIGSAQARTGVEIGLHVTVCDSGHLELIRAAEAEMGQSAQMHLKVDTGMGRLGLSADQALAVAKSGQRWAGVYTHFPRAGEADLEPTREALDHFLAFCGRCTQDGVQFGLRHAANSSAALRLSEARLDMVRIGTALYGQMPSQFVPKPPGLSADTLQAQAQVIFVHDLKKGDTVGYGSEFTAPKPMTVAVVPIGFADGFGVAPASLYRGWRGVKQILADRDPSRRPYVTIHGQRARVLGRIAMQMIVVDVSHLTSHPIQTGDIATVPLRRLTASALLPRRYI